MRSLRSFLLIAGTLASSSQLLALCKTYPFPNGELGLEGLYVQRRGIRKENLIKPQCPCRSPLTTANTVHDQNGEPGVRGFLRYMPSKKRTVEGSLTWVNKFQSFVHRYSPTSSYSYPFPSGYAQDFTNAQVVKARYTSQFWEGEANYWGHFTPRNVDYFSVSGVIGLRGMYIGEHFHLYYTKLVNTSSYRSSSLNRLVGVQIGGNIQWNPTCHWTWEFQAKTGILADFARQRLRLTDVNNTVLLKSFHPHKTFASYFLEGNMNLYYRFRPTISIDAGYRLLGLWNVALAPMQLTAQTHPDSGNTVDDSGKYYLHIVSLGLNFDF